MKRTWKNEAEGEGIMADINGILEERAKTHGMFEDVARASQELKRTLQNRAEKKLNTSQIEALENIAQKMARITCGNPSEPDHWRDIAGYATLIVNELEAKAREPKDNNARERR